MKATYTNLTATLSEVRSIPRAARVAQGFPRIRDFARHVMRARRERAKRRETAPDPIRAAICRRLQAALDSLPELRRDARRAAGLSPHDSAPCEIVYRPRRKDTGVERFSPAARGESYRKYHWRNGPASGTVYHPSTRHVSVPACWALARIASYAARQAERDRRAAERVAARTRSLHAQPHWLDRAAVGRLSVAGVDADTKRDVSARAREIATLRYARTRTREMPRRDRSGSREILWRGAIPMVVSWNIHRRPMVRYGLPGQYAPSWYATAREAAKAYLSRRMRSYGSLKLERRDGGWVVRAPEHYTYYTYTLRPTRVELVAAAITLPGLPRYTGRPAPEVAHG